MCNKLKGIRHEGQEVKKKSRASQSSGHRRASQELLNFLREELISEIPTNCDAAIYIKNCVNSLRFECSEHFCCGFENLLWSDPDLLLDSEYHEDMKAARTPTTKPVTSRYRIFFFFS